jgi:hypothetical protein
MSSRCYNYPRRLEQISNNCHTAELQMQVVGTAFGYSPTMFDARDDSSILVSRPILWGCSERPLANMDDTAVLRYSKIQSIDRLNRRMTDSGCCGEGLRAF